VFHVVDHTYAQLVHELPSARTVVTCHDIDAFRSVLEPDRDRRGLLYRAMTRRILDGLARAAHVTCDSIATRDALLRHGVIDPARLDVVYLGVAPLLSAEPDPRTDLQVSRLLGAPGASIDLLHVGSTIPRKRIDILLRVFAAARRERPELRLLRVGGAFTPEQSALLADLGLQDAVIVVPFLDHRFLGAVYRRAALVLQPSEAEGFGLPVAEAMACGTPVVATDLAVLREVGGGAATYCALTDIGAWVSAILALLDERSSSADVWAVRRAAAVQQASRFTWREFAARLAHIYDRVSRSQGGR
jgi:glycosyltransferase involved in cell wall biosynthesis